ncbi:MAG: DMT family transporter, partial [Candidatus Acidiferrum sp.]
MPTGLSRRRRRANTKTEESVTSARIPATISARAPYAWMLLGSMSFATMSTLAHGLGDKNDWQLIALARSGTAFLIAAILAKAAGVRLVFRSPKILWMRSLAGSLSVVCTFYALARPEVPAANTLTLTNMFPLWVALLCWPLYGHRPTPALVLALACGLGGVALIQQPHLANGDYAVIAALLASCATAVAMLGLHRLQAIDPRAIVVHFSGVSTFVCLFCFLVFERKSTGVPAPQPRALLMLFAVGVTATIGQLFLTKAFVAGSPTRVSLVALTQIPLVMLFDVVIWRHSFNWLTLLG